MGQVDWYKEAVIYELHVKCFYDSSGDGIGDFEGLTQKLDYLMDLGVTAIWLLPFYPSPLKDDGYDIADYRDVHPSYGLLKDFKIFLREAHKRGLKVITELVINHTSDQHPWFQKARKAGARPADADFYVWGDDPNLYKEARVIFQDFEPSNWAWDRESCRYYWHRFYSHQPDLNFDHPPVQRAIIQILSFWFKMGVDGLRLDAVPYLFEREGTVCENLPETHAFLKKLRSYVDTHFEGKMLLAEANQWPEEAAKYFGEGDECHAAFHFPLMPRLFMSIHLEDSMPIIEIMEQTPKIPDNCQWALFLRNHDELTLEMVTDEERDYMFRIFAHDPKARHNLGIRRRLAPLLKNDRRKIELMDALLFSLNGTPVIYYGDEIGMGDNIYLGDRDGVRTPMQWSNDRNAGFSKANPQQLYLPPIVDPEYHYETVNVESQLNNPHSLLRWTKQLIALRKRFKAFSYGTTQFMTTENRKVLVFFRQYQEELIMIVTNLSRFPQYVELDLKQYTGYSLIEMFSGERFPAVGELPYFITLGAYGYYWFSLEKTLKPLGLEETQAATIELNGEIDTLFQPSWTPLLERMTKTYLEAHIAKANKSKISLSECLLIDKNSHIYLIIVQITMPTGVIDHIPLFVSPLSEEAFQKEFQGSIAKRICLAKTPNMTYALCDLRESPFLFTCLLAMINQQKKVKNRVGEVRGVKRASLEEGVVKTFLRTQGEIDPDVEVRLFLSDKTDFKAFVPILGYLVYEGPQKIYLALAEKFKEYAAQQNARQLFAEAAGRFLQSLETLSEKWEPGLILPLKSWTELVASPIPTKIQELLEGHADVAELLGQTAAQLHQALSSADQNIDFAPVEFTLFHQRSIYQTMRRKSLEAFSRLGKRQNPEDAQMLQGLFLKVIQGLLHTSLTGLRLRYHGNFILDHLVFEGKEFLVTHFGGKAALSQSERKYKRSSLRDIAAMIYSITEVAFEAADKLHAQGLIKDLTQVRERALGWSLWVSAAFLSVYLKKTAHLQFMPHNPQEIDALISIFLFERCLDEINDPKQTHLDAAYSLLAHLLPLYGGNTYTDPN